MGMSRLAAFSVRACRADAVVFGSDQACVSAADSSILWAAPITSACDIAGKIYNDRVFVHKQPSSILRDVLNGRGQTADKQ